ncbi:hypothetical protein [Lentzea sp. HUAS12]|uniref:hypothetical protein n=1 Tax=Lentzea sp. HUAS12 TaxID=2951806 RepID=UPI00209EA05C|nr:hypothetical protein [Lentzea sp. HUAS12]USX49069.1 hypothetical protein ND450_26890 [Lentzea sp. HUAS12]
MDAERAAEADGGTKLDVVLGDPKFAADVMLAEYKSLRDEILKKMDHRTSLVVCSVTVSSAVLGFGIDRRSGALLLVSPLVSLLLGTLILFHNVQIAEISQHLRRRFEGPLAERVDGFVGWHVYKREPRYRFARRLVPYQLSLALIAMAPAVVAMPLALANPNWVAWVVLGVDLALLTVYVGQFAGYRSFNQTAT